MESTRPGVVSPSHAEPPRDVRPSRDDAGIALARAVTVESFFRRDKMIRTARTK